MPRDLLITGCSQLVTVRGAAPRRGRALSELGIIPDGALLVRDGRIAAVGPRRAIERQAAAKRASRLDAGGRVVLPGFVDSHTHLIFPASRADEYEDDTTVALAELAAPAPPAERQGPGMAATRGKRGGLRGPVWGLALAGTALAVLSLLVARDYLRPIDPGRARPGLRLRDQALPREEPGRHERLVGAVDSFCESKNRVFHFSKMKSGI